MTADLTTLNNKVDTLNSALDVQEKRLMELEASANGTEMQALHAKLDLLLEHMEAQRRRQQEMEELKQDLIPVANNLIQLTIDELAEIGNEFQLEDLLFLLKRLLRDTHLLVSMLNTMESTYELLEEAKPIGTQAFNQAILTLDRLEREGYFALGKGAMYIAEQIVREFSEEDVRLLGDNIVTILKTIRNLTQPEIMALTNNAVQALQSEPAFEGSPSTWALMKDLSDPQVRRGLSKLLNMVRALADQPPSKN